MQIPERIPGLKVATVALAAYAVVWISLEGAVGQVVALGLGVTLVGLGYAVQRGLGGRTLSLPVWLLVAVAIGLLVGLGSGSLALVFMAVKTGLHAHGPEFTAAEINWVLSQLTLWAGVGALAGLGLGLVLGSQSDDF